MTWFSYSQAFRERSTVTTIDGSTDTFSIMAEGQEGDMSQPRGNKAIKTYREKVKALHSFQKVRKGFVKYLGEMEYVDYFVEEGRGSTRDNLRKVIVFKLKPKER